MSFVQYNFEGHYENMTIGLLLKIEKCLLQLLLKSYEIPQEWQIPLNTITSSKYCKNHYYSRWQNPSFGKYNNHMSAMLNISLTIYSKDEYYCTFYMDTTTITITAWLKYCYRWLKCFRYPWNWVLLRCGRITRISPYRIPCYTTCTNFRFRNIWDF